MRQVPIISIVGKSDSGKTTFLEGLVRVLVGRGWRVATVKHHVHDVEIDVPGKDSWRHARAGAHVAMVSSPTRLALVRSVDRERTLDELAQAAGDVDILLTEGFKRVARVRIEVARRARSDELVSGPEELFALVTDAPDLAAGDAPVFGLDDHAAVADLIERTFLSGGDL
ncbi:MAG: molybdopterin-guanine dinucleotide biosynthesis protein B [Coriobacteriia bacterium]